MAAVQFLMLPAQEELATLQAQLRLKVQMVGLVERHYQRRITAAEVAAERLPLARMEVGLQGAQVVQELHLRLVARL